MPNTKTLGKTEKVIKICPDGHLRVTLDGHTGTFNPLSFMRVTSNSESGNISSTASKAGRENLSGGSLFPFKRAAREMEKLMKDTAKGEARVSALREYLRKYSGNVDARPSSLNGEKETALRVGAHQGHRELCVILLDGGASLRVVDEDSEPPPFHYAAFGNEPEVMEFLLSLGAPNDAVNNGRCSALHVAANIQHSGCVRVLLCHGCDVNLQDSYGATALHDVIGNDTLDIIGNDGSEWTMRSVMF
ncbi:E3 ubiquitin-protein ligase MIB2-like [Venturia canescens]|uniref:E3 ubiquitin-protein ligase MIB2-like n=1 Tax=Venturia canescens TaxID=32260 RepID=UPI001C9BE016|nr:E3 ubiquitin-protein ligase MIB2-like [Venturia canescens]XP_043266610.1 E3 ubiquitin-protein ligase MIB2-like [Venturia canescens]